MRASSVSLLMLLGAAAAAAYAHPLSTHYRLNIARQPLDGALHELAQQTGLQIARFADTVDDYQFAGPLVGEYSVEKALSALLSSGGLTYKVINDRMVAVVSVEPQQAEGTAPGASQPFARPAGDAPKSQGALASEAPVALELEQVIVTATKREVSVQRLPEAVTAVTAARLDDLNAQTFEDYFRTIPGLMLNSTGSGLNRLDFSLRGISSFNPNAPPTSATVGQYFDEVPVTAVGQQIDPRLVDIERIEVLRGPQGTYFGEDSLGGTIRIITKKPNLNGFLGAFDTRLSETAHGGTNDSESIMVNVPIVTGKLALRANYFNALDSGFVDNVSGVCNAAACAAAGLLNKAIDPTRSSGERGILLFEPSPRLSALAEVVHGDVDARNTASYEPKVGDLRQMPQAPDSGVREQNNLYNLTVNMNLDRARVVSSSSWGYRNLNDEAPTADAAIGAIVPGGVLTRIESFTQELRLLSSEGDPKRWDYILGAYYSRDSTLGIPYGEGSAAGASSIGNVTRDKAAFGELGFRFTNRLSARLGARHQRVEFENTNTRGPLLSSVSEGSNTPNTGRIVISYEFQRDVLGYASVSKGFRKGGLNPTLNPYNLAQPIPGIPAVYGPDTTTNYELGWKSRFRSHRARLNGAFYHIDWKDMQVPQMVPVPGGPPTAQQQFFHNSGRAKVDGLELEGGLDIRPGLRAEASFAWMRALIAQNEPLPQDRAGFFASAYCEKGCPARAGDPIPWVPKVSGSLSVSYRRLFGARGANAFGTLTEQYTGSRNTDYAATWQGPSQADAPCSFSAAGRGRTPFDERTCSRTHRGDPNPAFRAIRASLQANLQAGYEDRRWRAAFFVDNLFDRRNPIGVAPAFGLDSAAGDEWLVNRPRTLGVRLRWNFD